MRSKTILLVTLAVVALAALALPWVGTIAAITFIGLPLAFAYWAAPALFLIVLTALLVGRILPLSGTPRTVVSLAAAAALLAIPPYLMNSRINDDAAALAQADLDRLEPLEGVRSIASREKFRFARDATKCIGFCLHALLTGTAERFLVAHTDTPHGDIAPDSEAVEFRLERRDACPAVNYKSGTYALNFRTAQGDKSRAADPVETLRLRASEGECLVSRPATLAEADIVVSRGSVTKGTGRENTGFSLTANTISADRLTVHRLGADNRFEEIYRRTEVRYRPFGALLVPWVTMGAELRTYMGWWRTAKRINVEGRYRDQFAWTDFLTERLGLDLELEGEDTRTKTLSKLRKLLDEGASPTPAEWALFQQYFDRVGLARNTQMGAEDFDLALRMLGQQAYPAPPRLLNLVDFAKRHAGTAEMERLARLLVARLTTEPTHDEAFGTKPSQQINSISFAIRRLPAKALMPHKETMLSLVSRTDIQEHGYVALQRLSVYGDDAVPALLTLIKAGIEGGEHFFRDNRYQHPYLAGMLGLCFAGPNATTALPELKRLVADARLPDFAGYGRLLFTTLLRLGADRDAVHLLFKASARNKKNATDKRFERLVSRAFGKKPACHY